MRRVLHRPGLDGVPVAVSFDLGDEPRLIERGHGALERRDDVGELRDQRDGEPVPEVLSDVRVHAGTVRPCAAREHVPPRGTHVRRPQAARAQDAPDRRPSAVRSTGRATGHTPRPGRDHRTEAADRRPRRLLESKHDLVVRLA